MAIAFLDKARGGDPERGGRDPGPARLVLADLENLPHELDCAHPAGGRYDAIWVLAMRRGRPLGIVEIDVSSAAIEHDTLERRLREGLGADFHREPPDVSTDTSALPRASVVVPTAVARPEQLLACVRGLSILDYPDYEVIVIDNRPGGSEHEGVLDAIRARPRVRVLHEPRPGISAARNRGLAAASGEIVAFTDDDVEVDRRWLRELGRRFVEEPQADAVTGLVIPAELETPAQIWFERSGSGPDRGFLPLSFESAARRRPGAGALSPQRFRVTRSSPLDGTFSSGSLYATGEFGLGSNMAFRSSALRALGGFDEALGAGTRTFGGEDLRVLIELLAAGRGLAYEPAAIVHHTHRRTVEELERQIGGYGVGLTAMLAALLWRDPRHAAGLIAMAPAALRLLLGRSSTAGAGGEARYPPRLARAGRRGMLTGPGAYVRSRYEQRRWSV